MPVGLMRPIEGFGGRIDIHGATWMIFVYEVGNGFSATATAPNGVTLRTSDYCQYASYAIANILRQLADNAVGR